MGYPPSLQWNGPVSWSMGLLAGLMMAGECVSRDHWQPAWLCLLWLPLGVGLVLFLFAGIQSLRERRK